MKPVHFLHENVSRNILNSNENNECMSSRIRFATLDSMMVAAIDPKRAQLTQVARAIRIFTSEK